MTTVATCPKFLSPFCFKCKYKWLLMHYSQNRAFSPNFLHWCASSPFDDITKVRGEKSEGVQKRRSSEDGFSPGNTELSSQRGSCALLKQSESSCRPSSKQQHLHISHTSSLPWVQPDASVPRYTLGLLTVLISSGWLLIKQVNAGYSCTWCLHLYQ